jgi:dTDP-4-dehydrorhamnose 3,5-epimerase
MKLGLKDCHETIKKKVYTQQYPAPQLIKGVKIIKLNNIILDDGDFNEIMHFDKKGKVLGLANFKIIQINRTRLLPGSVKAWHLHFKQDEVWYLSPSDHLIVGLWDIRKNSPSANQTMRLIMGGGQSSLVYIPRGVAHGSSVVNAKAAELYTFVNNRFNIANPDEKRLSWDSLGGDFWRPQKDINPNDRVQSHLATSPKK